MHAWFKLACVVLAWTILPVAIVATGRDRPVQSVQASTRTTSISFTSAHPAARSAAATLTSLTVAPATTKAQAAIKALATTATPAAAPVRSYVVQPGDTLSAIAARFGVRGGWPVLYAANQPAIGPDPNALNVGAVLRVPSPAVPAHYTVTAGDSLSAIAARFGVRGGWPALYAANRPAIGSDPDAIHAGIRLTIPGPATAPGSGSAPGKPAPSGTAPSGTAPGHPQPSAQPTSPVPSSPPAAHASHPQPRISSGAPSWLKTMLLAVGLLAVIVFAAEPLLLARRRRRRRGAVPAPPPHQASQAHAAPAAPAGPAALASQAYQTNAPASPAPEGPVMPVPTYDGRLEPARIVMADHDRLVVTRSKQDDTVYVLRPPGGDPADILRLARLVLPESHYGKLAEQLGLSPNWPMNQ
jgi:LysM repeat protein